MSRIERGQATRLGDTPAQDGQQIRLEPRVALQPGRVAPGRMRQGQHAPGGAARQFATVSVTLLRCVSHVPFLGIAADDEGQAPPNRALSFRRPPRQVPAQMRGGGRSAALSRH